ncbi:hypothetical protein MMC21_005386 [Puttea exsequens]|nr:hypothetical protein [Puttea exsequens]
MPEGDTGAPRFGGTAHADAFTNREKANEDAFIRQREMEKMRAVREKTAQGGQGQGQGAGK